MREPFTESLVNKRRGLVLNFFAQQLVKITDHQRIVFSFDALKLLIDGLNHREWYQLF